jgi:hypothetical protein
MNMATPSLVSKGPAPRGKVVVAIELDAAGKNILVHPEKFWVHKGEFDEVQWICMVNHKHGNQDPPCFEVNFNKKNGSPFAGQKFSHDRVSSGCPTVDAGPTQYEYTVTVANPDPNGQPITRDPSGGVKP